MKTLQEMFEFSLMGFLSDEGSDIQLDEIEGILADMIPDIADSIAESMLSEIKKDAPFWVEGQREIPTPI